MSWICPCGASNEDERGSCRRCGFLYRTPKTLFNYDNSSPRPPETSNHLSWSQKFGSLLVVTIILIAFLRPGLVSDIRSQFQQTNATPRAETPAREPVARRVVRPVLLDVTVSPYDILANRFLHRGRIVLLDFLNVRIYVGIVLYLGGYSYVSPGIRRPQFSRLCSCLSKMTSAGTRYALYSSF